MSGCEKVKKRQRLHGHLKHEIVDRVVFVVNNMFSMSLCTACEAPLHLLVSQGPSN